MPDRCTEDAARSPMEFAEVLDSLRREGGAWHVDVPEDWLQGRTVFGGLQVAIALRAMRSAMARADLPLRSLQVTFVGPMPGHGIAARAEVLREGRSATQVRCDLWHAGAVACCVVAIFGTARRSSFALAIPRPVVDVGPETLTDLPYVPGVTPQFVRHIQLRWAQGSQPYTGQDQPRSTIYARLRDARCSAEEAVIALADAIPTPVLSMLTRPAPASSLNWMLELLGDPAELDRDAWSLIGTEVRAGSDGYLSQTSILWGASGRAFSVSHQSVAVFG